MRSTDERKKLKKKRKAKGFTLIEILAVIIIIGTIAVIGVVAVSNYIESSRKSAFITTAKTYIESAREVRAQGGLAQEPKNTEAVLIPLETLKVEGNDEFKTAYGKIVAEKSYVIIRNDNETFYYYITLLDETGHAVILEDGNQLTEDSIRVNATNMEEIKTINDIKSNSKEVTLNGIHYQLSNKNLENVTTVLLDCSILESFRIIINEEWENKDKTITVELSNAIEGYEYYISTRNYKPLSSDSNWQTENTFEKDLGTYYVFIKSPDGEISDGKQIVVDKIDKVKPSCTLKATGNLSSHGIYNSSVVITFDTKSDGPASVTTSGINSYGIGSITGESLVVHDIDGPSEMTYTGYVEDKAGNQATCEITIKSDGKRPTVDYSINGGVYNTDKSVIITPKDEDGEIDYYDIKVSKDGNMINTYENIKTDNYTVNLTGDGVYMIYTRVVDTAGNWMQQEPKDEDGWYYQVYTIDETKPTCTLTATGTMSTSEYYGTNVTISFSDYKDVAGATSTVTTGVRNYGIGSITGEKIAVLSTDNTTGVTYTGYVEDNAGNVGTCSITIKRKANFTLTYNNNGGTGCTTKNIVFNNAYGTLCSPTKAGYTFAGWYTAANGGTQVTPNTILTTGQNQTLYAHWTANNYTLTYNNNGGTGCTSKKITYNSTYGTLCTPTRTGYTFQGWYTAASGGTRVTASTLLTSNQNQTIYAHWTINNYTLTYNNNGGTGCSSKTITYGSTYGTLCTPTRSGYNFLGWYTAASGGAKVTSSTIMQASNQTIYAHWEYVSVPTVIYNGGSNTCTWKNNYNFTLSSTAETGISYYEIDWNSDGIADSTTGSNFIPWNGYSSCTTRFRAVSNSGNRSGWTGNHHIHMDTQAPAHTNWWWGEVTKDVARLYIQTSDNIGINRVQCPTSTATGGYNNWHWFNAVWDAGANAYRCDITPSTFNHYNQTYITHLYIYDHAGNGGYYNQTSVGIPANSVYKCRYRTRTQNCSANCGSCCRRNKKNNYCISYCDCHGSTCTWGSWSAWSAYSTAYIGYTSSDSMEVECAYVAP